MHCTFTHKLSFCICQKKKEQSQAMHTLLQVVSGTKIKQENLPL